MPPAWPLLGHVMEFTTGKPSENLTRLSKAYGESSISRPSEILSRWDTSADTCSIPGPIFRLNLGKRPVTFVTSQRLVNEICDEKRFVKSMKTVLGVSCPANHTKDLTDG
jgi:cytochrome P450 / NADPH-cytochrome P450 reductase